MTHVTLSTRQMMAGEGTSNNHSTVQSTQGNCGMYRGWGRALRPRGSCSMGAILTGVGQCHSMNICTGPAAAPSGVQAADDRRTEAKPRRCKLMFLKLMQQWCSDQCLHAASRCQDTLKNLAISVEAAAVGYACPTAATRMAQFTPPR